MYVVFDGFSHNVLPSMTKGEIFRSLDVYDCVVIDFNTMQVFVVKWIMWLQWYMYSWNIVEKLWVHGAIFTMLYMLRDNEDRVELCSVCT
jgi:hypothetical protein